MLIDDYQEVNKIIVYLMLSYSLTLAPLTPQTRFFVLFGLGNVACIGLTLSLFPRIFSDCIVDITNVSALRALKKLLQGPILNSSVWYKRTVGYRLCVHE